MAKKFLIYDFETLGVRPDTAVLSLGWLLFDLEDIPSNVTKDDIKDLRKLGNHVVFTTKDQITDGRSVNQDTVRWWTKQKESAKVIFDDPNKINLSEGIYKFYEDVRQKADKDTIVYIRGQDFDSPILTNILDSLTLEHPYNHWKVRDTRTVIDFAFGTTTGYIPGFYKELNSLELVEHYALDDCIKDAIQIKRCYELIS